MMKINLYRCTWGSGSEMGDTTLCYSEDNDNAINICNRFKDPSGELSAHHATFFTSYNEQTDRYLLVHVQGHQWEYQQNSRQYPYRSAFEITRTDYAKNSLTDIIYSLPRIASLGKEINLGEQIPTEFTIQNNNGRTNSETCLTSFISYALLQGKYLYIELDRPVDECAKGDGIFDMEEFKRMVTAIDAIPDDLKPYATFSFLADHNYEADLKYTYINVVQKGCDIEKFQNCIFISWAEATTKPVDNYSLQRSLPVFTSAVRGKTLPSLKVLGESVNRIPEIERLVQTKQYDKLQKEDWGTWISIGHTLSEIAISDSKQYTKVKEKVGRVPEFVRLVVTPRFIGEHVQEIDFWEKEVDDNKLWNMDFLSIIWQIRRADGTYKPTLEDVICFLCEQKNPPLDIVSLAIKYDQLGKIDAAWEKSSTKKTIHGWLEKQVDDFLRKTYKVADVERWAEYANEGEIVKKKLKAQFDKLIQLQTLQEISRNLIHHVNTLQVDKQKDYVINAKPYIDALCEKLDNQPKMKSKADEIRKMRVKVLHPNRQRHKEWGLAALVGIVVGVLLSISGFLLLPGNSKRMSDNIFVMDCRVPIMCQLAYMTSYYGKIGIGDAVWEFPLDLDSIHTNVTNLYAEGDSASICVKRYDGKVDTLMLSKVNALYTQVKEQDSVTAVFIDGKKTVIDNNEFKRVCNKLPCIEPKEIMYYFWLVRYLHEHCLEETIIPY